MRVGQSLSCGRCGGKFIRAATGPVPPYCSAPCRMAAYYLKRREDLKAAARAYYHAHKGQSSVTSRAWRTKHPDERRAYFLANKERRNAGHRDWSARNPERVRHVTAARRARKTGNGGSHTLTEWLDKCALLGNVCFYCGEARPLSRDHNIPLSRGGTDDISNILPACNLCNCRKHMRTAAEFLAA